jgi:hypothetical protein
MMGERFCLNTTRTINDRAVIEQKPITTGWWLLKANRSWGVYDA